jgi:D-hydroxyproline dehydrogenase subunit gamma
MPDLIPIFVNGHSLMVSKGTVASAALLIAETPCRLSIDGQPRIALCGMGICFECRAMVNGVPHSRTCQILCQPGMTLETQR